VASCFQAILVTTNIVGYWQHRTNRIFTLIERLFYLFTLVLRGKHNSSVILCNFQYIIYKRQCLEACWTESIAILNIITSYGITHVASFLLCACQWKGASTIVSKLNVRQMSAISCVGPYESLRVYHCTDLDVRFCGLILQSLRKLGYELQKQTILNIVLTNKPKWRERFG
jgi:hypothetical protein